MEILRKPRTPLAALAAGAVLLAGCGKPEDTAPTPSELHPQSSTSLENEYDRYVQYYPDGSRASWITFDGQRGALNGAVVVEHCDGPDLVSMVTGHTPGDFERSASHLACNDGRLTPEDFPATPTPPVR